MYEVNKSNDYFWNTDERRKRILNTVHADLQSACTVLQLLTVFGTEFADDGSRTPHFALT